ncbi:hypothetical protein OAK19_03825 [Aureispira]|nr:hypothetical protein [Aureispira sp.]
MTTAFQQILDKFSSNPKKLFLTDSIGAGISAIFLGVILVWLEEIIGMPTPVLFALSSMACVYAIYSICCYFILNNNWQPYLNFIAFANLAHCIITIGLIVHFYHKLTILGLTYFGIELIIIFGIIIIEFKVASNLTAENN